MQNIETQARLAMSELVEKANIRTGQIVVVGCSTSEVMGQSIGSAGTMQVAHALLCGLMPPLQAVGAHLAVQCCEHLNRALVLPAAVLERKNLIQVCALPHAHAGGSLATGYYELLEDAVLCETLSADAGLDIGDTLIGMHLRRVAVPLRLTMETIGKAHLTAARTRPPLIGGERTHYPEKIR